jgi:hypothetical protein
MALPPGCDLALLSDSASGISLFFPGPSGFSPACRGDVASPLPGNHGRAHPCSSAQSCSPDATHTQKSESNNGLAHPYLSAQPCTPFGTKCHPGGGPAPGGGPERPTGAAITWAGAGGFDGWAANQKKDAATPAPPTNAPTTNSRSSLACAMHLSVPCRTLCSSASAALRGVCV